MRIILKHRTILVTLTLLLAAGLSVPVLPTTVHAQFTGKICLVPAGSSSCPPTPATIFGTVGSQVKVAVFIQGSDPINAFDVIILADHTILQPVSADMIGSVLPTPLLTLANCIGNVGTGCSPPLTTLDTVRVAAVCIMCLTPSPTTGLLFTATYNVLAASNGLPVGFQTGCAGSSVLGTTICVTTANGSPPPVPETVQAATFATTTPAFAAFLSAGVKPAFKHLSISKNGDTQTLTASIGNTGTTTAFVKVGYTIVSETGSATFEQTSVVTLAAGTSTSVSVSYAVPMLPLRYFVTGSLLVSGDGTLYVQQGTDTTSYSVHT